MTHKNISIITGSLYSNLAAYSDLIDFSAFPKIALMIVKLQSLLYHLAIIKGEK
jgi:hypothetical protein